MKQSNVEDPAWVAPPHRRNDQIDAVRGIAILSVLLLHFSIWLPLNFFNLPGRIFGPIVSNGYYGVSIFFVISGYLITSRVLARGFHRFSAREFYVMRFGRIAPCLLLMVAVVTALTLYKADAVGFDPHKHSLSRLLLYVFTFRANRYVVDFGSAGLAWDVLWSLAVEEVFYLALPPLVKVCRKPEIFLVPLALLIVYGPVHRAGTEGLNDYLGCFDLIALGCLTAVLAQKFGFRENTVLRSTLCWTGAAIILWCYWFRNVNDNRVFGPSTVGLGTALLLYASAFARTKVNLFQRGLAGLGAFSYELYLFHMPLLSVSLHCARLLHLYPASASQNAAFFLLWSALLLSVTTVIARCYAEPVNRLIRQRLLDRWNGSAQAPAIPRPETLSVPPPVPSGRSI